jgi:hypothetical protein
VSLFQRDRVGVGVGATEIAVAFRPVGAQVKFCSLEFAGRSEAVPSGGADRTGALVHALKQLLDRAGHASGSPTQVVLTPASLKSWIMQPPAGVNSLSELRSVARARCVQIFGGSLDSWSVTADWRVSGPILCAAAPQWLSETVESTLLERKQSFGIQAFLSLALARAKEAARPSGWLCVQTPEHVILAHRERGRIRAVRTFGIDQSSAADSLGAAASEARRENLRLALAPDSDIALFDCSARLTDELLSPNASFSRVPDGSVASAPREAFATDAAFCAWAGVSW